MGKIIGICLRLAAAITLTMWLSLTALPAEASPSNHTMKRLAYCESGNNPRINTGNGYYGLYQFSLRTWQGIGGRGYPHHASRAEQTRMAKKLVKLYGFESQFPGCSKKLGLR